MEKIYVQNFELGEWEIIRNALIKEARAYAEYSHACDVQIIMIKRMIRQLDELLLKYGNEEPDTSDIPEQTDSFFKTATVKRPRGRIRRVLGF